MNKYQNAPELADLALGKTSVYPEHFDERQLQGVPRKLNRDDIQLTAQSLPFSGVDCWTGYEISWLNDKGKPCVAIGLFSFDCRSENLVESKSFKLFLNSFNQTKFATLEDVQSAMQAALQRCSVGDVGVRLLTPAHFEQLPLGEFDGVCLDDLDIEISDYAFNPNLLEGAAQGEVVSEVLTSNLLKSNCLITGQPDWGSIQIKYEGRQISHEALLRYLISFRQHNEFHEQCVERIFADIMRFCAVQKLTVYARYTRRGGLDINPFRSNFEQIGKPFRTTRQ